MRLADFIDSNMETILSEWEQFAASLLPAARNLDPTGLRDHAQEMLDAIAKDLRTAQTPLEQSAKSKGLAPLNIDRTAAQAHALLRAADGFSIRQLVAEYRALRASVLHLWSLVGPDAQNAMEDSLRFNEAIDQAIAESVDFYMTEVERWRALFLGILGHDLRGPLNAVLLTSQVISALSHGTPVGEYNDKLMRSGERMRELLDDLLDYNRTSLAVGIRANPEPIDLTAVCFEEIELMRAALPLVTIEFASEGDTQGTWDPSRLKQAISNLVINASKYGDLRGTIHVKLHADDAQVKLSVENTGPAISKELMNSMFEPLHRHPGADEQSERVSLGLGLFIVREVALAHGGSIFVDSADGVTTFTMVLPKSAARS
jgi:signal transduction histidine kinase